MKVLHPPILQKSPLSHPLSAKLQTTIITTTDPIF